MLNNPSLKLKEVHNLLTPPLFITLAFVLLIATGSCQTTPKDTIQVFYLIGQSNMVGYGHNADLPDSLRVPMKNVWIYHGNPAEDGNTAGGQGIWAQVQPGNGMGFYFNGQQNTYSNRFGAEISFAQRLQELYPNQKLALIKYAEGGTAIDCAAEDQLGYWDVNNQCGAQINQYDHFLTTVKGAYKMTEDYAVHLVPAGIIWMQGESDASYTKAIAERYQSNLNQLMEAIRAELGAPNLPIVIGKISDSYQRKGPDKKVFQQLELVQAAQENYVKATPYTAIVRNTGEYGYSDPAHYDSAGYLDLGRAFAEAVYQLREGE